MRVCPSAESLLEFVFKFEFVLIILPRPQKAIVDCCRVIELDPDNVKAYYRRAQAHQKLNNFSKAHDDLLAALRIDPSDEDVGRFLNTIESHLGILPKVNMLNILIRI